MRKPARQRGWPDRRGMGAQSDFIAEPFVPGEDYKAKQLRMTADLIAAGVPSDQLVDLFLMPAARLEDPKPET